MTQNKPFKRIALLGRAKHISITETLTALADFLTKKSYHIVFEEQTAAELPPNGHQIVACDQLNTAADLLIVIGGDGSLLHAARIAVDQDLPVLGINRGRLGFLTDISPDKFDKIIDVINGQYHEEQRFLLTMRLRDNDRLMAENYALNDVVLMPSQVAHLFEFEVYINDEFVYNQRADGLIIATPTGSTAYALSGGGPIVHPTLDAMVLVPMFPHTLTSRPIVIDGNSQVKIVCTGGDLLPHISCDGQPSLPIEPGQQITIYKKAQALRLIHPLDYDYYQNLRAKLHWHSKRID